MTCRVVRVIRVITVVTIELFKVTSDIHACTGGWKQSAELLEG